MNGLSYSCLAILKIKVIWVMTFRLNIIFHTINHFKTKISGPQWVNTAFSSVDHVICGISEHEWVKRCITCRGSRYGGCAFTLPSRLDTRQMGGK